MRDYQHSVSMQIGGEVILCRYNESANGTGNKKITGVWMKENCETKPIRATISIGVDTELHIQQRITKELAAGNVQKSLDGYDKNATLMDMYEACNPDFYGTYDWAASTVSSDDRDFRLRLLSDNLLKIPAHKVSQADIAERMRALTNEKQVENPEAKKRGEQRIKNLWLLLCRFLAYLVRQDMIPRNPVPTETLAELEIAEKDLLPTATDMYNKRNAKMILTRTEANCLLEAIASSDNTMALGCGLMLLAGNRNGEVCAYNCNFPDTERYSVPTLRVELCAKTKNAPRMIPCTGWLEEQIKRQKDDVAILASLPGAGARRHPYGERPLIYSQKTATQIRQLRGHLQGNGITGDVISKVVDGMDWHENMSIAQKRSNLQAALAGQGLENRIDVRSALGAALHGTIRRATSKEIGEMGKNMIKTAIDMDLDSMPCDNIELDFDRTDDKIKETLTAYKLRHTYATLLYARTALSDADMAYCMGHKQEENRYLPPNEDTICRLAEAHKCVQAALEHPAKQAIPFREYLEQVRNTGDFDAIA